MSNDIKTQHPTPKTGAKLLQGSLSHWVLRLIVGGMYLASIAFLVWLGWKNRETLQLYLNNAHWERFAWALVAYGLSLGFALLGWVFIMRTLTPGVPVLKHIEIFTSTMAARRLPGTIWYFGGRLLMYERIGVARRWALAGSSIEWVVQMVSAGLVGLILLMLGRVSLPQAVMVLAVLLVLGGLALLHPKILKRLVMWRGGSEAASGLDFRYTNSLVWLFFFSLMWVSGGGMVAALVSIVHPISQADYWFICGAFSFSGAAGFLVLFLPSSFGAADLTLVAFLAQLLPLPLAGAVAVIVRLLTFLLEMILALLSVPFLLRKYY